MDIYDPRVGLWREFIFPPRPSSGFVRRGQRTRRLGREGGRLLNGPERPAYELVHILVRRKAIGAVHISVAINRNLFDVGDSG